MGFLLSLFTVAMDTSLEITEKIKEYIVSDEQSLKNRLKSLGVNLEEVIEIDTGKSVSNWSNVMGVFKKDGNIYAYTNSIGSEMEANLKIFA